MFEDWLDILIGGHFELTFPEMTLVEGKAGRYAGSGHITWNRESGIRIVAATSGGEKLEERFGQLVGVPGQLIPHDKLLRPVGRSQDDWNLEAAPVTLDGYTVTFGSP